MPRRGRSWPLRSTGRSRAARTDRPRRRHRGNRPGRATSRGRRKRRRWPNLPAWRTARLRSRCTRRSQRSLSRKGTQPRPTRRNGRNARDGDQAAQPVDAISAADAGRSDHVAQTGSRRSLSRRGNAAPSRVRTTDEQAIGKTVTQTTGAAHQHRRKPMFAGHGAADADVGAEAQSAGVTTSAWERAKCG